VAAQRGKCFQSLWGRAGAVYPSAHVDLWVGSWSWNAEDMCELWACLEQGVCPALQELDMSLTPCSGGIMARCLRQGLPYCPDLSCLRLNLKDAWTVMALAAALEQGLYPKLDYLGVRTTAMDVDGGGVIAAALRAFPRPGLEDLKLDVVNLGVGVAAALQSGACRGLRRLDLRADHPGEGLILAELVDALCACPHLRMLHLHIRNGEWGESFCRALTEAMREGGLPGLKYVYLFSRTVTRDSSTALAEALEARAGRLFLG
jgi:hypothetical protein